MILYRLSEKHKKENNIINDLMERNIYLKGNHAIIDSI